MTIHRSWLWLAVVLGAAPARAEGPGGTAGPFCGAPWGSVVSSLSTLETTKDEVTLCADNSGGADPGGPQVARCVAWRSASQQFVVAQPIVKPPTPSATLTVDTGGISACVGRRCRALDATLDQVVDDVSADRDAVSGSMASNPSGTVVVVTAKAARSALVFDGATGARRVVLVPTLKANQTIENVAAFDELVAVQIAQRWQFFTLDGRFAFAVKGDLGAYAPIRVGMTFVVVTDVKHRFEVRDDKTYRVLWRGDLPQLDLPDPGKRCACTIALGQLAAGGGMPADVNAVTAAPDGRVIIVAQRGLAVLEPGRRRARTFAFPRCAR
jgi:hypothetical protein